MSLTRSGVVSAYCRGALGAQTNRSSAESTARSSGGSSSRYPTGLDGPRRGPEDQWNVDLRLEEPKAVARHAVITKGLAVIRNDDDEQIPSTLALRQARQVLRARARVERGNPVAREVQPVQHRHPRHCSRRLKLVVSKVEVPDYHES